MLQFYLARLERKPKRERQAYLNETVAAKFRDEVRTQWNESHPGEELD